MSSEEHRMCSTGLFADVRNDRFVSLPLVVGIL